MVEPHHREGSPENETGSERNRNQKPDTVSQVVRIATAIVALIVVLFLCFNSNVYFQPFNRAILLLLVAALPAIMFGAETAARFEIDFKWLAFSAFGLGAFYLGVVYVAYLIGKPELQVVAIQVVNEKDEPVVVDAPGVVSVSDDPNGYPVSWYAKSNKIIMIFPEQATKVTLRIADSPGKTYSCDVAYAGNRKSVFKYGAELK